MYMYRTSVSNPSQDYSTAGVPREIFVTILTFYHHISSSEQLFLWSCCCDRFEVLFMVYFLRIKDLKYVIEILKSEIKKNINPNNVLSAI